MMSGGARGFSERPGRRGGGDRTVARGWMEAARRGRRVAGAMCSADGRSLNPP